MHLLTNTLSG